MRLKLALLGIVLVGFVSAVVANAAPLAIEQSVFFDDFDRANAAKQSSTQYLHFPDFVYNRSRSPNGAVLMEIVDPLRTNAPFQGITRTSTDPYDIWEPFLAAGDVGTIMVQSDYTRIQYQHIAPVEGPEHGIRMRYQPGTGTMHQMDAGATIALVNCNDNGPATQFEFHYRAVNGHAIAISLTTQCRSPRDMVYIEVWSTENGSAGPIMTRNFFQTDRGVYHNKHIQIDASTFTACADAVCSSVPLTNVNGYDVRPVQLISFSIGNAAWYPGQLAVSHVRDVWAKWVTEGEVISQPISPPAGGGFLRFEEAHQNQSGQITFDILDSAGAVLLPNVTHDADLSGISTSPIRLRASFTRPGLNALSPVLDWWQVVGDAPTPTPTATATQTFVPPATRTPTPTQGLATVPPLPTRTPLPTGTPNATWAPSPSPSPTRTPDPLLASIWVDYSALLYLAPELGQPTQVLHGFVSGGVPPYTVQVRVQKPAGTLTTYLLGHAPVFNLHAANTSDPYFGVDEEGEWSAWIEAADSQGWTVTSLPVRWYVAWYPVHGQP